MRKIVLLLIAAVAAGMGYLFMQPVCAGGAVVRDEAQCRATAGFDAAFCRDAFGKAPAIARASGPSYSQRNDCDTQWPVCAEHAGGWGPRPAAWCLVRDRAGLAKRIEPQYDKRG